MKNLDLNQEVTIYAVSSRDCYEDHDLEDDYNVEVSLTLEEAKEDAKDRLQYHPQGGMKLVFTHSVKFKVADFIKENGLDIEEIDSIEDIDFKEVNLGSWFFDEDNVKDWAEVKLEKEEHTTEDDIEGKLVISYQHYKYMNYAHKLQRMRFAGHNEHLSSNPDHTFTTWDLVTDLKIEDFKGVSMEEAVDLVREELIGLKYNGIGFPSIESILEDCYELNGVLTEEE